MADVWKSSCGRVCDVLITPSMGSSVVVAWAPAPEPAGDRLALVPPPSWGLAWALLWPLRPVLRCRAGGRPQEVASKGGGGLGVGAMALLWPHTFFCCLSPAAALLPWPEQVPGTGSWGLTGRECYFEGSTSINFSIVYILNVVGYFTFILPTFWIYRGFPGTQ